MADIKRAVRNTFQKGITPEEARGAQGYKIMDRTLRGSTNVLLDRGVEYEGIPMTGPGYKEGLQPLTACMTLTKKGNPCKSHPVKGTEKCVGHTRQNGS